MVLEYNICGNNMKKVVKILILLFTYLCFLFIVNEICIDKDGEIHSSISCESPEKIQSNTDSNNNFHNDTHCGIHLYITYYIDKKESQKKLNLKTYVKFICNISHLSDNIQNRVVQNLKNLLLSDQRIFSSLVLLC